MKMKRTMAILGSALMFAMTFTSCALFGEKPDEQEKTVMNISCNPSVEFVLDKDDKVVSVNALNEEGNLVINAEVFEGKSAEEAAKLFVEVSNETGFVVSGNATIANNEISISFSGDTKKAEELYNDVKGKVNEYLSAENITAQISKAEAITEAKLEELVAQCAPYVEKAKIEAMEYNELMNALYESRKETAKIYSQELKNAYYDAKAFVMEQAEIEVLKSKLDVISKAVVEGLTAAYTTATQAIESSRMTFLVAENSIYQLALKAFREAKIAYLNYREYVAQMEQNEVTTIITTELNRLEQVVNTTEAALVKAGEDANKTLDGLKATAKTQYDAVISMIESNSVKVNDHLTEINTKQQEAKTAFFTSFETQYGAMVTAAKKSWTDMQTQLQATATPEA